MVSVLAGILDLKSGCFRWASAGQMPPYRSLGNAVSPLPMRSNLPLGARPMRKYNEQQIQLAPGELLFFTEQRLFSVTNPAGENYREEALLGFLANRSEKPTELVRALYARIRQHAGRQPRDDLTFFAVRWLDSFQDSGPFQEV